MADGPDACHTRAWAGGPSHAIPSDPSSGPSARRVLVRPVYSFNSTSHTIYLSVFFTADVHVLGATAEGMVGVNVYNCSRIIVCHG